MSNKYELKGFDDLLDLEPEQVERFAAELPRMVEYCKALADLYNAASGALEIEPPKVSLGSPLVWIDDGKQDITASIKANDEEVLTMKVTDN